MSKRAWKLEVSFVSILKSVLHAPAPSVVTVHGARAGVQLSRWLSLCAGGGTFVCVYTNM